MAEHDQAYKKLFSHQRMVMDLLHFINEPWVAKLDLESLETFKDSFVSDTLRSRHDDIIWRVRLENRWLYIYLLIEFQSSVDPFMAVRLMVYVGLLYQHLIETQKLTSQDKLPPVLPIVIYNGIPRWGAAKNVSELIEGIPGFKQYRPHLRYYLIDEGGYENAQLEALDNLVATLIRLEKTQTIGDEQAIAKAIGRVLTELVKQLKDNKWLWLRRDWVTWLKRVLLPRNVPNIEIPEIIKLQEMNAMLYENMQAWYDGARRDGKKEGFIEGEKEGKQEGILEGKRGTLIELLEDQFGNIDGQTRFLIFELGEESLRACFKRLKSAQSVHDVVGHLF